MLDMLNSVKTDTYFTPRTYGIEGLTVNGFDVDSIFVAGSNVTSAEDLPTKTIELLRFHIRRSLLSAVFLAIGLKKYGVKYEADVTPLNATTLTVSEIKEPSEMESIVPNPDVTPWYINAVPSNLLIFLIQAYVFIKSVMGVVTGFFDKIGIKLPLTVPFVQSKPKDRTSFFSGSSLAKNVTVVLDSRPYIAAPPPLLPEDVAPAISETMQAEVVDVKSKIAMFNKNKNAHEVAEYKKLLVESTEIIYYSGAAQLERLNIYDRLGMMSMNPELLAKAVKKKFEVTSIGSSASIPDISFIFPGIKKQVNLFSGVITSVDLDDNSLGVKPMNSRSQSSSKPMEVVLLNERNGKQFITTVFRKVVSMIDQGLIKPDELESTLNTIYEESYIAPGSQLVITSGLTGLYKGLPPFLIKGAYL